METSLRKGSYCQVMLREKRVLVMGLVRTQRDEWVEGIIISLGAKRAWVSVDGKVIQKRLAFVRPV